MITLTGSDKSGDPLPGPNTSHIIARLEIHDGSNNICIPVKDSEYNRQVLNEILESKKKKIWQVLS